VTNPPIKTEVIIIGAGPVGLFQAFQLGLHGIKCHIVDTLPIIGGQCNALYPDKTIYDIPALPAITAQELIERLTLQLRPFSPEFHLSQLIESLEPTDQGFTLITQSGLTLECQAVVIAAGVGAFLHKELPVAELKPYRSHHSNKQVVSALNPDVSYAGRHITVYGGDDTAVLTAIQAAQAIRGDLSGLHFDKSLGEPQTLHSSSGSHNSDFRGSVTLVYRRDKLDTSPLVQEQLQKSISMQQLEFRVGQITGISERDHPRRLSHLKLTDTEGLEHEITCDILVESLGLSPKLGPIASWGLQMEKKALVVNTESFETQLPGVYAVGDINTYPGKRKLILCGFHEATLAAFAIASRLNNGKPIPTEYTSASGRIHSLLGVSPSGH
jgi:thioredoxin reductase (NADPH)